MVGTVLSVLVLYGVALLVLSVYRGTGAGHSPRLRRQVSAAFGEVGSGASGPPLRRRIRFSRLYSLHSLSISTAQCLSCPILASPPCHGAHQNSIPARLRRAGKSRPVFAVQPQQTLASLTTPACSLESDLPSGGRTGTARNQRLALLQLASPSRPARQEPMSDRGKMLSVCSKKLTLSAYV